MSAFNKVTFQSSRTAVAKSVKVPMIRETAAFTHEQLLPMIRSYTGMDIPDDVDILAGSLQRKCSDPLLTLVWYRQPVADEHAQLTAERAKELAVVVEDDDDDEEDGDDDPRYCRLCLEPVGSLHQPQCPFTGKVVYCNTVPLKKQAKRKKPPSICRR